MEGMIKEIALNYLREKKREREMEGIKELAIAYYERATEEEKGTAREYFKRLDQNGDGKVSLLEFKNSVSLWLSKEEVFKQLDPNGKGTLGFNEVLALYYMYKRKLSLCCSGCHDLLLGQFFSCSLCLPKYPNSVNLCCHCYREGEFKHEHSTSNFSDHRSLLIWFMNRLGDEERTQEKKEMEELGEVARAYYRAGAKKVQALAHEFFDSMDNDGDGQIDMPEFLEFMRQEGHYQMNNPYFFKELDKDGNGTLDFWEVMTLYYIMKSGRPFCRLCGNFIPGVFFSCVECSFTICRYCYGSAKCNHNHDGQTQFLDNYTLLKAKQDSVRIKPYTPTYSSDYVNHRNPSPSASTAIVPMSKRVVLYKALEAAVPIINISGTLCTIL